MLSATPARGYEVQDPQQHPHSSISAGNFKEYDADLRRRSGIPARSGKQDRLSEIRQCLGIAAETDLSSVRYQLLHRAASATKLARRFSCDLSLLVIHSFGGARDDASWEDFERFAALLGTSVERNQLSRTISSCEVPLMLGWISDVPADLSLLRNAI
jgi:hypothetical protein